MHYKKSCQSGFGIVELFIGSTVLSVAVLAAVGGLMTSLKLTIDTKSSNLANDDALSVVEGFRKAAVSDFNTALVTYNDKETSKSGGRKVYSRIILDETQFAPPIDLNGDGDFDDSNLTPGQVNAAYLETKVLWGRDKSMTFVSLIARNAARPIGSTQVSSSSSSSPNQSSGGGTSGSGSGSTSGTGGGPAMNVTSSQVQGDKATATIDSTGQAQIVAVTVNADVQNYVAEIKIGGVRIFSDKKSAPSTGTLIATSTGTINEGANSIEVKLQETSSGGKVDLAGQKFNIVLHHESGATTSFTVQ